MSALASTSLDTYRAALAISAPDVARLKLSAETGATTGDRAEAQLVERLRRRKLLTDFAGTPLIGEIRLARARAGLSWASLAEAIDMPVAWTVSALYGQHPLSLVHAEVLAEKLGMPDDSLFELTLAPYRGSLDISSDPTVYRFHEALKVYGPALKELIAEEFGDGIMSAINFTMNIERRPHDDGDRIVVTFDGKFLDYRWTE